MAMVKMTSSLEANRSASFSSYLNGTEETFVLNLDSTRNFTKKADDGEIDIFSAEKYFNEGVDEKNQENVEQQNKHKIDEQPNLASLKPKTRPITPSIHSESSWNSRSALLQNNSRKDQQPQAKSNNKTWAVRCTKYPESTQPTNNKSYGKKFLATLGCNCNCKDKNSVKVENHVGGKSSSTGKFHGRGKQNPIKTRNLAQSSQASVTSANQDVHFKKIDELGFGTVPIFDPKVGNPLEEETRKSLEVFGSSITEKEGRKLSIEKKLSMLTWDAIASKHEEIDIINIAASSNGTYEDDYAESDASSDLFEIESFPSYNTTNPFLARQFSDGMSSCVTPTTCYAPSEVSIDWSVVTASAAADFSAMSDSEEFKVSSIRSNSIKKEKMKRRSSILLGCNSHKAVGVVGDAYKVSEKTSIEVPQRQLKNEAIIPTTRFHAESKLNRFDAGKRRNNFTSRSFSSSYTGYPADFLCI